MTAWRFEGASNPNFKNRDRCSDATDYLLAAGGAAGAVAGGAAVGAGAGVPAVAGAAGAAAACGCAAGLTQQAWTRLLSVSATLGSIWLPKRVRQRNAA